MKNLYNEEYENLTLHVILLSLTISRLLNYQLGPFKSDLGSNRSTLSICIFAIATHASEWKTKSH